MSSWLDVDHPQKGFGRSWLDVDHPQKGFCRNKAVAIPTSVSPSFCVFFFCVEKSLNYEFTPSRIGKILSGHRATRIEYSMEKKGRPTRPAPRNPKKALKNSCFIYVQIYNWYLPFASCQYKRTRCDIVIVVTIDYLTFTYIINHC